MKLSKQPLRISAILSYKDKKLGKPEDEF